MKSANFHLQIFSVSQYSLSILFTHHLKYFTYFVHLGDYFKTFSHFYNQYKDNFSLRKITRF
jgi:hypothetical protein